MTQLQIDDRNSLFFLHHEPTHSADLTWVFFNALTGDTGMWEDEIGHRLRAAGMAHSALTFAVNQKANLVLIWLRVQILLSATLAPYLTPYARNVLCSAVYPSAACLRPRAGSRVCLK
jgi:hypothetical protein